MKKLKSSLIMTGVSIPGIAACYYVWKATHEIEFIFYMGFLIGMLIGVYIARAESWAINYVKKHGENYDT
jgi:hypothetical protein